MQLGGGDTEITGKVTSWNECQIDTLICSSTLTTFQVCLTVPHHPSQSFSPILSEGESSS